MASVHNRITLQGWPLAGSWKLRFGESFHCSPTDEVAHCAPTVHGNSVVYAEPPVFLLVSGIL